MEDEATWRMIAEMLCGEASDETLAILYEKAKTNEPLRSYIQVMQTFWNSPTLQAKNEFDEIFEKIVARLAINDASFFQYNGKKLN